LDPGGDVRVGLCGQPQVVGGVAQRRMTHIRLQDRQQRADVLTLSEPETEIVDREGVAVMGNSP
jgi:negative regulator of sigma E activity